MRIRMMNKETEQVVVYNDAEGYDTHGAIETENGYRVIDRLDSTHIRVIFR